MTALESRKKLLVAESELNRAQLVGDLALVTASIGSMRRRARSFSSIVSSATTLALGLAGRCRGETATADTKPSWLQIVLKTAGLISNILPAFLSQKRAPEER